MAVRFNSLVDFCLCVRRRPVGALGGRAGRRMTGSSTYCPGLTRRKNRRSPGNSGLAHAFDVLVAARHRPGADALLFSDARNARRGLRSDACQPGPAGRAQLARSTGRSASSRPTGPRTRTPEPPQPAPALNGDHFGGSSASGRPASATTSRFRSRHRVAASRAPEFSPGQRPTAPREEDACGRGADRRS